MKRSTKHRLDELCKWSVMLMMIVGAMWLYDWNENQSPWGKAAQAAKTEYLKSKLCN